MTDLNQLLREVQAPIPNPVLVQDVLSARRRQVRRRGAATAAVITAGAVLAVGAFLPRGRPAANRLGTTAVAVAHVRLTGWADDESKARTYWEGDADYVRGWAEATSGHQLFRGDEVYQVATDFSPDQRPAGAGWVQRVQHDPMSWMYFPAQRLDPGTLKQRLETAGVVLSTNGEQSESGVETTRFDGVVPESQRASDPFLQADEVHVFLDVNGVARRAEFVSHFAGHVYAFAVDWTALNSPVAFLPLPPAAVTGELPDSVITKVAEACRRERKFWTDHGETEIARRGRISEVCTFSPGTVPGSSAIAGS